MNATRSQARRCGVEIEFSGLDAHQAARVIAGAIGGTVDETGRHTATVHGTEIGDVTVLLDTRFSRPAEHPGMLDGLLDRLHIRDGAAGFIADVLPVPVEMVTRPLTRAEFAGLDRAIAALRAAGAGDTKAGTLYAFGMHLNPEFTGAPARAVRIASAYAFAEPWLRHATPPDNARRVTPFVDPYPEAYVLALAEAYKEAGPSIESFIDLYAQFNPDRNRGLDMWPLFGHLAPDLAEDEYGGPIKNPRPAFHYRLPDSLIALDGWSPRTELDRWERIERAADDAPAFERLRSAAVRPGHWLTGRQEYYDEVEAVLGGNSGGGGAAGDP